MKHNAYTDGACRTILKESGVCSCAFAVVRCGSGTEEVEHSRGFLLPGKHTNNYAEYMGLLYLTEYLEDNDYEEVTIYSDSKLVINHVLQQWKCNNPEFRDWANLIYARIIRGKHRLLHVRGHNGNSGNELVDRICNEVLEEYEQRKEENVPSKS